METDGKDKPTSTEATEAHPRAEETAKAAAPRTTTTDDDGKGEIWRFYKRPRNKSRDFWHW